MCSKKWYFEKEYIMRCSSAELLETDVPWDDAILVWVSKLRKLWDSLSELRSSLCERRLERTVVRPALLPLKTAQFTQFFRQVWHHTVKSLSLTESVLGALRVPYVGLIVYKLKVWYTVIYSTEYALCLRRLLIGWVVPKTGPGLVPKQKTKNITWDMKALTQSNFCYVATLEMKSRLAYRAHCV